MAERKRAELEDLDAETGLLLIRLLGASWFFWGIQACFCKGDLGLTGGFFWSWVGTWKSANEVIGLWGRL